MDERMIEKLMDWKKANLLLLLALHYLLHACDS